MEVYVITTFLDVQDVYKVYTTQSGLNIPALRGTYLQVARSEFVAIIGPSGSGKSTLLKLIAGFDSVTSGKILVEDVGEISSLNVHKMQHYHRDILSFISQFPSRNLISSWSVKNNVLLPMKLSTRYTSEECQKRSSMLLALVELQHRKELSAGKLSGGEAQRLSLAMAVAKEPTFVLADEPTGELDSENTAIIIEYFKELNRELGTTIIVVTHNVKFAQNTDRTWKISDGRISGFDRRLVGINVETTTREEVSTIDEHGTVTIPEEVRKKGAFSKHVKIKYNEHTGKIELESVHD